MTYSEHVARERYAAALRRRERLRRAGRVGLAVLALACVAAFYVAAALVLGGVLRDLLRAVGR